MGNICASGNAEELKQNKAISKKNKQDFAVENSKIKMLLLGPGESGKSAMFKQIKLLHGAPHSAEDLAFWRQVIHSNVIEGMQAIVEAAKEMGVDGDIEAREEMALVEKMDSKGSLSDSYESSRTKADIIEALWKDKAVQSVWARRSEFQVVDSHRAFFNDIQRIANPAFQPSSQDTVLARVRTTGVVCDYFTIQGKVFALYDVGGQRNERKKWIHVFDHVHAIIFVVGLSEYNQTCFEDTSMNRMEEGLAVFEWISSHQLFLNTPIILFLNKADLFSEKIVSHPINEVPRWADYTGGADYSAAWQYFYNQFAALQDKVNPEKQIYAHVTNATDPGNVEVVFNAATDLVLQSNLDRSGLA